MSLPLVSSMYSPAYDFYVNALRSAAYYGYRVYDQDYGLQQDPDLPEKIQRDPVIKAAYEQRLHKVAGKDWTVTAGSEDPIDKSAAGIVHDALDQIARFTMARYELAKVSMFGRAMQFIKVEKRRLSLGGFPEMEWEVPVALKDIDKRRFDFQPVELPDPKTGQKKTIIVPRMRNVLTSVWEQIARPEFYAYAVYDDEEARLGYGRGLSEALYFYWRFKCIALEQGLQGLERWAQGLLIAKVDDLRVGSAGKSNTEIRDEFIDVLKKHRSQHVMAIGPKDEVTAVETTGSGHQLVMEMIRYLDEALRVVILGSTRPSGGGEGGAYAQAKEEAETTESLIEYDRILLDETITRDIIGLFWKRNRLQLSSIGLQNAKMPRFATGAEKRADPKSTIEIVTAALAAGIKLKASEVYERIDFTQPAPTDDVIEGRAPAAPMPFGAMPGFGGTEDVPGTQPTPGVNPPANGDPSEPNQSEAPQ